ncbi:MAG TPA: hypothetical protein DD624_02175 [Alphaproteobacteria bacterium]|nr:hypothetical protein [Alphaproteobacteria bacterium]
MGQTNAFKTNGFKRKGTDLLRWLSARNLDRFTTLGHELIFSLYVCQVKKTNAFWEFFRKGMPHDRNMCFL